MPKHRASQGIWSTRVRIFQHTPGTYQNDPQPTVYGLEFLSFGGERESLGYAKQGNVGVPREDLRKAVEILVFPKIGVPPNHPFK